MVAYSPNAKVRRPSPCVGSGSGSGFQESDDGQDEDRSRGLWWSVLIRGDGSALAP